MSATRSVSTGHRPLVSVVVPLHNGAKYIAETLTSIERQTMSDVEVIVVDDGSTDGGHEVVTTHPLAPRLIRQPGSGVAVARNQGLLEARGRWVTFLDQDDLWHPTRLDRLVTWLAEHPEERLVATSEVAFDTHDERSGLTALDPLVGTWASVHVARSRALDDLVASVNTTGTDRIERHDHLAMLYGPVTVTTSFIADPTLLQLAGGFAPHAVAMDDYWLLVNAARIHHLTKVDQPTAFYRVHLGATSRTTRLALPFLSSAVALRLGGALLPVDEGLGRPAPGPLHAHLLTELSRSSSFADPRVRSAARSLARLLWPDRTPSVVWRGAAKQRFPRTGRAITQARGTLTTLASRRHTFARRVRGG